jgi:hypothetical protein
MTTTYENLNKWYNKLLDKFGRVLLTHMNYKQPSYENELNKFIERSTEEINLIQDNDRKRYLTIMKDHINQLINKLNTIKNIKGPIKRTRKTSEYNQYVRANFKIVKKEHPDWSNEAILKHVIKMWNELGQKGGFDDEDPYDVDMEEAMSFDDLLIDNIDSSASFDGGDDDIDVIEEYDYSGGEFEQDGGQKNKDDDIELWKKQIKNLYL